VPTGVLVIGVTAVAVGLGVASIASAARGDRLVGTWGSGRLRGGAVLVALAYLGMAAIIIYTITDAAR